MNLLVVVFGVLSGMLIFKERIDWKAVLGLILGVLGILCLAKAM